jgi:hypothetical protein
MTIATLKRHMDRRFDRLQRTKVDKSDLARFATKEDLKRFATKEDLKRFATKEDLKRFATKEDLKRFATKEDLKPFATKEDLKRFATKEDLKPFPTRDELSIQFAAIHRQFESLSSKVDSLVRTVRDQYSHHDGVLTEHDRWLTDLERRSEST